MNISYLKSLAVAVVIPLSLIIAVPNSVNALPRNASSDISGDPIFLGDLECIATQGSVWRGERKDIVLDRAIYTSVMRATSSFMNSYYDEEFSCKLPKAKNAELNMQVGIPTNGKGPFLLNFYLNGTKIVEEKIFPNKITVIQEKLTGRDDIDYQVGKGRTLTVQTTCLAADGCTPIYFLKADLDLVINPGDRTSNKK
jgi:hypothetical protein